MRRKSKALSAKVRTCRLPCFDEMATHGRVLSREMTWSEFSFKMKCQPGHTQASGAFFWAPEPEVTETSWDIVIYNIFGLHPYFLAHSSLIPWNFLSVKNDQGDFCYDNEVTLDPTQGLELVAQRTNQVIKDLELFWSHRPQHCTSGEGGGRGWRLEIEFHHQWPRLIT